MTECTKSKNNKHYYILESPNGGLSTGVCKYCKKEKVHYNSQEGWTTQQKKNIVLGSNSKPNNFNPKVRSNF